MGSILNVGSSKEKPTLVMVHGFAQSACSMYTLYEPLMKHYRIVTIDMLGYGNSSRVKLSKEVYNSAEAIDDY